ncbi:hypothetical protein JI739_21980 [Ramlibacter sp. AW1]|uniref:Ava_C0101 and related proteins n=1 Tax=Ramlibacter aurantiacus TaxID=2801330 RepID=A0A937D767_9BURK|nr:DUF5996 family protein [Ramlibacter aurantiacus]MBL0423022.1 hypothetical protein [Ramlibacter aurantiacus]
MSPIWPAIPYPPWRETCSALHLYAQMIGKYRFARAPWQNHSWQATLYVNARGFTTSLVPDEPSGVEITLDLVDHAVVGAATDGRMARFALGPMSVADFHAHFLRLLGELGATPALHGRPNEVPDAVPFVEDRAERPYDRDAVSRFFRASVLADRVLKRFRTGFLGKASPVHLFWGSFDLAVTRFSGRAAPMHPGGIHALPDDVTREAYSHEVSSAGFWPGGGPIDYPAFYSYAYPAPAGFAEAHVEPEGAFYSKELGEFLLPYHAVRQAADPEAALMAFLESTYRAAADLGGWNVSALECAIGEPRQPRALQALGEQKEQR